MGFQIRAAGIEADPFAHQAQCGRGAAPRSVGQAGDPGIARAVAARYREKCARAQAPEGGLAVKLEPQLETACEFLQQAAVAACVEGVGRQCREPTRQIVSGGGRERYIKIGEFSSRGNVHSCQLFARFRLAFERGEAKRCRLQRSDGGAHARVGGTGGTALLPQQQRLRIAVQGAACELACRLQALKSAGLVGRHATTSSVSACAPTRR